MKSRKKHPYKVSFVAFGKKMKMTINTTSRLEAEKKIKDWLFSQVTKLEIKDEFDSRMEEASKLMNHILKN